MSLSEDLSVIERRIFWLEYQIQLTRAFDTADSSMVEVKARLERLEAELGAARASLADAQDRSKREAAGAPPT